ncbi:sensor histidine kinase [Tenuibacillus multivorans]|uniref:Signal transduction histidine-protein kinase/phosphatase DegS n=1 Tax=Tenuibacillus multivorans TaxID=237069 RepID=A0A1H0G6L0_9BACI|nr:sensor histidine kinase [Tenuibacillus multivorans]GEL78723.1 signal transduction histidine-protein kinase/phosphatase DegS [Tenuibacillus multivorans]SDO02490.1 two-component system, NarL family, sensor histidine kinase DegS [Tenuibacillus multivorans]
MRVTKDSDKALDQIIEEMTSVVANSKQEVFEIGEEARKQQSALDDEVQEIKVEVKKIISESDQLDRKLKASRVRLSEVSKNFEQYSEEEVRKIYNSTHELQTQLAVHRQKEVALIKRRDELEKRIKALANSVERAEKLMSKINVILTYLQEDFKDVNEALESAKEKHAFGLQIIEAQEEERRKLSREIHDGPAQMLANVLIRSDIVDKTIKQRGVDEAIKEIKEMKEMVRSALYEVRRIIYDLRPMALDDLGLVPTLRKYLSTTEDYHDMKIDFVAKGKEMRYGQKFEAAVFRLVQEAVQNAVKHSQAKLIRVLFEATNYQLNIHIVDDGIGFDKNEKKDQSFGLIGMRERIEMLDGDLKVDTELGNGTKVKISLPNVYES